VLDCRYSTWGHPVGGVSTERIRFGDFQLDPRAGELVRGKVRIRLQEQPLQILLMLLDKPGELVTREEIRNRLWPNDTVVEFDHSIGTAIKKLRQALDDEAGSPCYVETIPRRGFRLIVPVVTSAAVVEEAKAPPPPAQPHAAVGPPAPAVASPQPRRRWWPVVAFLIAAVVLSAIWLAPRL